MNVKYQNDTLTAVSNVEREYVVYRREGYKHCAYAVFNKLDGRLLCLTEYLAGAVAVTVELNRLKEGKGTGNGN